jgi:hypothetical protein
MKSGAVAETSSVDTTRKPTRPAAKPPTAKASAAKARVAKSAAPRKRTPAKPAVPTGPTPPPADLTPPHADRGRRRRRLPFASAALVVLVAASTAGFLVLRGDDRPDQSQAGSPTAISAKTLASFASSHDGPVYWAGPITSRKLELTTTRAGTFVRYLPLTVPVGDAERAITVATYPLRDAYATAAGRAKSPQMTSRETPGGDLVVWNRTRPTSVYLAFPGVPHLVEVYAPDADQARRLALSGRIRPVRS